MIEYFLICKSMLRHAARAPLTHAHGMPQSAALDGKLVALYLKVIKTAENPAFAEYPVNQTAKFRSRDTILALVSGD